MYKVILSDGTEIENCEEDTTARKIVHRGETHEEAANISDLITPSNTNHIEVVNEQGDIISESRNLIIENNGIMGYRDDYKIFTVTFRDKTDLEVMQDEIAELQEVVIEG